MRLLFILFVLSIGFSACGPNYHFEQAYPIQDNSWQQADTLDFVVEIEDTLQIYNLYLDVEHQTDYPFQNIYLMIHTEFPSGQRIHERVSVDMADKAGRWYGDCNSESCQLRVNIQQGAFFNAQGPHKITVEQYMRLDPLPGIRNVAFRVEKTKNRRS